MTSKCIIVAVLFTVCLISPLSAEELNWNDCKTLLAKNEFASWYEYDKPLLPLLDDQLQHVTKRTAGDRLEYLQMRLGVKAAYRGSIILSPQREPKGTGFYFFISITKSRVYLETKNHGTSGRISEIIKTDTVLTDVTPSAVYLTITNDTLELRHEPTSSPFLRYHDERFGDVKYFGLASSAYNGYSHAVLYYDC